nr:MAG TPA: hypothetical protein [Caudoviricetes sp.]
MVLCRVFLPYRGCDRVRGFITFLAVAVGYLAYS